MTTTLRSSLRRRTTAASAALLLGVALTACGGGDDDASDDPSPRASQSEGSETASTTSTPDAPPTSADTEAPPADVPSEKELEAALLTAADVPDGFTPSPDDGDDDGGFEGTCLADIGDFKDTYGAEPDEEAEVDLESETPTGQAAVNSQVEAYADAAKLAPAFATFTDKLQTCTSVKTTEDGVTYALDITYDDTVDLSGADDQLTAALTGTVASGNKTYPVSYRFVVALAGQFVSVVGAYTIGEDATGVVDSTADLAALQADRVAELG